MEKKGSAMTRNGEEDHPFRLQPRKAPARSERRVHASAYKIIMHHFGRRQENWPSTAPSLRMKVGTGGLVAIRRPCKMQQSNVFTKRLEISVGSAIHRLCDEQSTLEGIETIRLSNRSSE
jgi:hypothetical protein